MLTIKGPRDINGNARKIELSTVRYADLHNSGETINVSPAEFRRLAKLLDVCLNAVDADELDD